VTTLPPVPDEIICEGESTVLDASTNIPTEAPVTFESYPSYPFGFFNHPPANPYLASIDVNSVNPMTLTDPVSQLESVCIDIATDWNADLNIFLRAPNGTQIELSTGNGGGFDNYTNTCFSPTATIPITAGTAPFTGTFLPEGSFNDLIGTDINGQWSIVVTDAFGINDIGEFISWSITFVSTNEVAYTWTPSAGLSCDDCPDPTAMPATTTEYIINSLDSYGCAYADTITVGVVSDIAAPEIVCRVLVDDEMNFRWDQVGGFTEYEINVTVNGIATGWFGPISSLEYDVTGLSNNDEVTIEVRVYLPGSPVGCPIEVGIQTCVYSVCEMEGTLVNTTDASCFGEMDGTVAVTADLGEEPYSFFIDGDPVASPAGNFAGLSAGDHFVAIEDFVGCVDTVFFTINQPDEVVADAIVSAAINCFNADDGVLVASATGGSGTFTYTWDIDPGNPAPSLSDIGPGTYTVTATDSQNCSATATVTITEPDSLEVTLQPADAICFGSADGSITSSITGGTGSYTFAWNTAATTPDLQDIVAGDYCLSVTDANGCMTVACATVSAPETVTVDAITATPALCQGENTGTATVVASGGTGPGTYTYLWNDPLGQITETATSLLAGDYEVTVIDANGCTTTAQVTVAEPAVIDITPTLTDVLCFGEATGSIELAVSGGVEPYDFDWSNNDNTATINTLEAGIYNLTLTDANGCMLELDYTIGEPAAPLTVDLQQTYEACFGQPDAEITATANGGTGAYNFTWSDGQDGFVAMGLDTVPIMLTVTDENGCTVEASITPEDLDPVVANVIPNFPSCFGLADGRLGVNDIAGGAGVVLDDFTFDWSNGQSGPVAQNLAGDQSYVVTVTDFQGCQTVVSTFLPQPDPITFDTDSTAVLCFDGADGTASIINIAGSNPDYTVQWDNNANNQIGTTATDLEAGTYSATITDALGCEASTTIAVIEPTPLEIQLAGTDNLCFGGTEAQISAVGNGGIGAYTFSWSTGDVSSKVAGLTAGTYEVTLTDDNGCTLVESYDLIDPDPILAVLTPENIACSGGRDGRIEVAVEGGTPPYRYSLDNDNFNGASTIVGLTAGIYDIFIEDANGCIFTDRTELEEPPTFVVDGGGDETITLGDSIQLNAMSVNAQGEVSYIWSAPYFGTLSCNECPDPWVNTQNTISYELYGIDSLGCEATDRLTVFVEKPRVVVVPTGFSPNGDNTNDRLLVHGLEGTRILKFQIFDRWGEMLYEDGGFEVNDDAFGWDGTFRNEPMSSGVYLWYVEAEYIDGNTAIFRGQTTLIR
jgi:gliding motility-associated-like protein